MCYTENSSVLGSTKMWEYNHCCADYYPYNLEHVIFISFFLTFLICKNGNNKIDPSTYSDRCHREKSFLISYRSTKKMEVIIVKLIITLIMVVQDLEECLQPSVVAFFLEMCPGPRGCMTRTILKAISLCWAEMILACKFWLDDSVVFMLPKFIQQNQRPPAVSVYWMMSLYLPSLSYVIGK